MDKILFLNELCNISSDPVECRNNLDLCMANIAPVNAFYEALKIISQRFNAFNEIIVNPVDFSKFTVPPGEFAFAFSNKIKQVIPCPSTIVTHVNGSYDPMTHSTIHGPDINCIVSQNEDSQGYVLRIGQI